MTLVLPSQLPSQILGCLLKMSSVLKNRVQQLLHVEMCWGPLALQSTIATVWSLVDVFRAVNYYPSTFLIMNSVKAGVQESHHSSEPQLYLMIKVPEVSWVTTAWGCEFQADVSFFLDEDTDIASFLLPSLSQCHLGCAGGMPKRDITAATSLTITTSPFSAQGMIVGWLLSFNHRELPLESYHHLSLCSSCQTLLPQKA